MQSICSKEDKNMLLSLDLVGWEELNHYLNAATKFGSCGTKV